MLGRSHNGCGTTTYGKRDFLADGSFVTTKWIIFLYIPLLPLCSMRVRLVDRRRLPDHWLASLFLALGGVLAFSRSANYVIHSKTRPALLQVLYVYLFVVAFFLAWWALAEERAVKAIFRMMAALWPDWRSRRYRSSPWLDCVFERPCADTEETDRKINLGVVPVYAPLFFEDTGFKRPANRWDRKEACYESSRSKDSIFLAVAS